MQLSFTLIRVLCPRAHSPDLFLEKAAAIPDWLIMSFSHCLIGPIGIAGPGSHHNHLIGSLCIVKRNSGSTRRTPSPRLD